MPTRKCLACGQFFKPCPQTREQRFCSKTECQSERRRRTKEKQRQSNFVVEGNHPKQDLPSWNSRYTQNPTYATCPETIDSGQLPPGRYLLTRLDNDGIGKGHAWLAEIRILSAFPDVG
jgi:hypothetical protein